MWTESFQICNEFLQTISEEMNFIRNIWGINNEIDFILCCQFSLQNKSEIYFRVDEFRMAYDFEDEAIGKIRQNTCTYSRYKNDSLEAKIMEMIPEKRKFSH